MIDFSYVVMVRGEERGRTHAQPFGILRSISFVLWECMQVILDPWEEHSIYICSRLIFVQRIAYHKWLTLMSGKERWSELQLLIDFQQCLANGGVR